MHREWVPWIVGAVALVIVGVLLALLLRQPVPYDKTSIPSKRPLVHRQAIRSVTCRLSQVHDGKEADHAAHSARYLLDVGGFRALCEDIAESDGPRVQFVEDLHDVTRRFLPRAPTVDWTADEPFTFAITQTFLCAFVDPDTHRLELTTDAASPLGAIVRNAPKDIPRGAVQFGLEDQIARLELRVDGGARTIVLQAGDVDHTRWQLAKVALGAMISYVLRTWNVVLRALLRELCTAGDSTLGYCHPVQRLLEPLNLPPNVAMPCASLFQTEITEIRPWLYSRLYGRITEHWNPRWGTGLPQLQPALVRFALRILKPAYGNEAALREDREVRAWTHKLGVPPPRSAERLATLVASCHVLHLATRTGLEALRAAVYTPLMPAYLAERAIVQGEMLDLAEFFVHDRGHLSVHSVLEAFLPTTSDLASTCIQAFALLRELDDFDPEQFWTVMEPHFSAQELRDDLRNVQRDLRVRAALRE